MNRRKFLCRTESVTKAPPHKNFFDLSKIVQILVSNDKTMSQEVKPTSKAIIEPIFDNLKGQKRFFNFFFQKRYKSTPFFW